MAVSGVPGQPVPWDVSDPASRLADLEQHVSEMRAAIVGDVARLVAMTSEVRDLHDFENPFGGTVGTVLSESFHRTIAVPTGYTRATVIATATAQMYHTGSTTDAMVSVGIGTNHPLAGLNFDTGNSDSRRFPASEWVYPTAINMKSITGLDEDSEIAIGLFVRTAAITTVTHGSGAISATIIFAR